MSRSETLKLLFYQMFFKYLKVYLEICFYFPVGYFKKEKKNRLIKNMLKTP